jgi:hypothetical protein
MSRLLSAVSSRLRTYLKTSLKRTIRQTSIAAVFVAVVGYYFTYQDRIDSRQQNAWNVVRTALEWSEKNKWGNVGQIAAVQTLTRDCDAWWIDTPLKYLLGRDCVPLKSLSLRALDFGGLNAPRANLSYSDFKCANFTKAQLMRSDLTHVDFKASTLAYADFSGANLAESCLYLADVSGATLDKSTAVDPANLLKACIRVNDRGARLNIDAKSADEAITKIADRIPVCPSNDRCNLLPDPWSCGKSEIHPDRNDY